MCFFWIHGSQLPEVSDPKQAENRCLREQWVTSLLSPVLGGPQSLAAPNSGLVLLPHQPHQLHRLLHSRVWLLMCVFSVGLTGPQGPQGESLVTPIPAFQHPAMPLLSALSPSPALTLPAKMRSDPFDVHLEKHLRKEKHAPSNVERHPGGKGVSSCAHSACLSLLPSGSGHELARPTAAHITWHGGEGSSLGSGAQFL